MNEPTSPLHIHANIAGAVDLRLKAHRFLASSDKHMVFGWLCRGNMARTCINSNRCPSCSFLQYYPTAKAAHVATQACQPPFRRRGRPHQRWDNNLGKFVQSEFQLSSWFEFARAHACWITFEERYLDFCQLLYSL